MYAGGFFTPAYYLSRSLLAALVSVNDCRVRVSQVPRKVRSIPKKQI
jgi:hypothetical protein